MKGGDKDEALGRIPSNFICPISLEPMEDPVTLCTGQTYERANIQRWLAAGNSTCPATMQRLSYNSLTPNHTLKKLIHNWYSKRGLQLSSRDSPADLRRLVHSLLADVTTSFMRGEGKVRAVRNLRQTLQEEERSRILVLELGGIATISSLLHPMPECFCENAACAEALSALILLPLDDRSKRQLAERATLASVVGFLHEGCNIEIKTHAVKLIESILALEDLRNRLGGDFGMLTALVRLIAGTRYSPALKAGLSALKLVSTYKQTRPLLVEVGAVIPLVELLKESVNKDCVEIALVILDMLCTTAEGRAAINEYSSISVLVGIMRRVSETCTQHAMSVLWAVCRSDPEQAVLQTVQAGAASQLLLIIQSSSSPLIKQKSIQLLKFLNHNFAAATVMIGSDLSQTIQFS